MCGIFGCICENAVEVLLDGLRRLEYRGYDSVGIALLNNNNILIRKDKGKLEDFLKNLDFESLSGSIGIGHTRWATHGAPSRENAHPHLDCFGRIAVVHNGVLENFLSLREELIERGHKFSSNTDSEIIAHLIEEFVKMGLSLKDALRETINIVKGSIACAIITTLEPGKIFCYRRESPLIVGISRNGTFCSSDMPAIIPYTKNIAIVPEDTIVVIERNGIYSESSSGIERKLEFFETNLDLKSAERGGYPHFMIKEIFEQPRAISDTIKIPEVYLDRASKLLGNCIYLTGSGTSYHACLSTSYTISKMLSIEAFPIISSELQEMIPNFDESTLIAVSQSGETADTLNAIRYAKKKNAKIVGITNTLGSSITMLSDAYICTQSGPEIGVAATKTFVTQLIALDLLFLRFGLISRRLNQSDYNKILDEMKKLPKIV
ncbi:MAG: glutamine--fructose-6-phosphate transaminase (isomerizing), partial [Candidatus Methanomethyliaceae archaeon]|nr:glutamine--fructose-6-phosphate transaminase (isomerizing) [Candidatus Methanomethyliaceae archaeon]